VTILATAAGPEYDIHQRLTAYTRRIQQLPKTRFVSKILNRREKIGRELVEDYLLDLARERDFFQELFDAMSEGVLAVLEDGRALFANTAAQRFLGIRASEVLDHNVFKFLQQPELSLYLEEVLALPGRTMDREIVIQTPTVRVLNVSVFPLRSTAQTNLEGILVLMQDVTDERARAEERKRMEKLLSIGHMAAGMAHEIRNPLNSLSLRLQILRRSLKRPNTFRDEGTRQSVEEDISVIEDEIGRLNHVVEHVLSASASIPRAMQELSPRQMLEELVRIIGPECEEGGVEITLEMQEPPDPKVFGDPHTLRQVFLNIVKNAIQAMPNGGGLFIGFEKRRGEVCFLFRDTGTGMSDEEREKIFEPYYTTRAKGTGLGLVIVQSAVQNHGGLIEVDTAPGKGAEFRLLLPIYYGQPRMIEMKEEGPGEQEDKKHTLSPS